MKYVAGIEYHGSAYHGWQRQRSSSLTIQAVVETAISRVADHTIEVIVAGRTDKGVHATQQIIHFETYSHRSLDNWLFGINTYLPPNVRLLWIRATTPDFHARFSALSRRYCYLIYSSSLHSAFYREHVAWDYRHFDVSLMAKAAQAFVGTHDFTAFRAARCQSKSPIRTVHFIRIQSAGPFIFLDIQANGFLYHMVRNIVGVLLRVGASQQPVAWSESVLNAKDRCTGDITAPASGLYFIQATYPAEMGEDIKPRWPYLIAPWVDESID